MKTLLVLITSLFFLSGYVNAGEYDDLLGRTTEKAEPKKKQTASSYDEKNFFEFCITIFEDEQFVNARKKCDQYDIRTQSSEAVKCYEKEARKNPTSPHAQYLLGAAYIYAEDLPGTMKQYSLLRNMSTNFTMLLLDGIAHIQPTWLEQLQKSK